MNVPVASADADHPSAPVWSSLLPLPLSLCAGYDWVSVLMKFVQMTERRSAVDGVAEWLWREWL